MTKWQRPVRAWVVLMLVLACVGCSPQGGEVATEAGEKATIRFTHLVPLEVVCGDPDGTPIDGHVVAVDVKGREVTRFSFGPGRAVVMKSYPTSGLEGSGQIRVYAPAESCRNVTSDVLHVTAYDGDGNSARAELPVKIIHLHDGGGSGDPRASLPAVGHTEPAPFVSIVYPTDGAVLEGVQHRVEGVAKGLSRIEVVVKSRTGEYSQGVAPVVAGRFQWPIYLGEAVPGRGQGEFFEIFCKDEAGRRVGRAVQVKRGR